VEAFLGLQDKPDLLEQAKQRVRELSPNRALLFLDSQPSGATVLLNSQNMQQKTPLILADLQPGSYRVELFLQGHRAAQLQKTLIPGELIAEKYVLTPLNP
jgi:hypothetical protein